MSQPSELDKLRHSAAHLLGAAVLELYPDANLTIGPAIDSGFYYDVASDETISDKDLPKIEKKMRHLVKNWQAFERREVEKKEALEVYKNNPFKTELIEEFAEEGKTLSLYKAGDFEDLCRGGHSEAPSKELKHFKLLSVAGAYWRGDENKPMLTRIYGTAFFSKDELDAYLNQLEEAKKRDHRKLGKELDLFTFSEKVGPGLPLWTPRGTLMREILDDYIWELRKARGFERVEIPHITKKDLYETSGHWDKFGDELFRIETREGHQFVMKPMNCPHHTQIYARKPHSYREMPQRFANTTMVYRDEQTGELNGLSRVRSITQDDSHIFCRASQVEEESNALWDIINEFYAPHGFDLWVRLSMHDPAEPDKYLGGQDRWLSAEEALRNLAKDRNVELQEAPGEAAFYGPKLDFMGRDSLGREWQLSTIQLDFNMPERFDLSCINEEGEKERIVMIHYAVMGSIERCMSILIEHYAGAFPVWLSPEQVRILPIADRHHAYGQSVLDALEAVGLRGSVDTSSESLSKKIRNAQLEKVPYMLVVGDQEAEANQVAVRQRGSKAQEVIATGEFVEKIIQEVSNKKAF